MDWIDVGQDVHALYRDLLGLGNSVMRIEDHLTMHIPGAEVELGEMKANLISMIDKISALVDLVQPAGVNHD